MKKFFLIFEILLLIFLTWYFFLRPPPPPDLSAIYREYLQAVSDKDFQKLGLLGGPDMAVFARQSEATTTEGKANALAALQSWIPDTIRYGAQVFDGERAILRLEGYVPVTGGEKDGDLPFRPRIYGTVFFVRSGTEWKIDHQSFILYKPSVLVSGAEDATTTDVLLWGPQFSAHHTQNPDACAGQAICLSSWAVLRRDAAYCRGIPDVKGINFVVKPECFLTLASLTGDTALCNELAAYSQYQYQVGLCKKNIAAANFLPTINTALIDSDRDGLTDLQEAYFNTAITDTDTDNDGVSDADEVLHDSNPLGSGRLGDHLNL